MEQLVDIDNIIVNTNIKIIKVIKELNIESVINVNNSCGVYILWLKFGHAYIGKSEVGIRNRIRSHMREGWHRKIIKNIDVYFTETPDQARELEEIMIYKLRPELNNGFPISFTNSITNPIEKITIKKEEERHSITNPIEKITIKKEEERQYQNMSRRPRDEVSNEILKILKEEAKPLYQSDIRKRFNIPEAMTSIILTEFFDRNIIEKIKKGRENLIWLKSVL